MGLITSLLCALKFPLKLLFRGKRSELEEKQRKYVRNFAPGRLKNVSWKFRDRKSKGKMKSKKRKFSRKKTNNFSGG